MARCIFFCCCFFLLVHRTRSDWVSAKNSREISINIAVTISSILYWIKTAGLMDSRWLWISIKRLIQFSDYNALIIVQTILPKMREIEGNLKKRYAKLVAQILLGPCHWIKTQSDIACISWFPYDIHKNCYCYIWVICLILMARIASDWWRNTKDHGKEKGGEAMSRLFSPSFAQMRETLLGTRKGHPIYYRASVSIIRNPPEEVSCRV